MDKTKIISDIDAVIADLLNQLSRFDDENFVKKPAEGWSACEVAEHLYMLAYNVNRNLRARTMPAGRPADEKVDIIITVFGDYDRKYNAPEAIIPAGKMTNRREMMSKLEQVHKRLEEVVETTDLSEVCKGFNHPSLGAFTRFEWIYFIIHHAYRHIFQMGNVLTEVKAQKLHQ